MTYQNEDIELMIDAVIDGEDPKDVILEKGGLLRAMGRGAGKGAAIGAGMGGAAGAVTGGYGGTVLAPIYGISGRRGAAFGAVGGGVGGGIRGGVTGGVIGAAHGVYKHLRGKKKKR